MRKLAEVSFIILAVVLTWGCSAGRSSPRYEAEPLRFFSAAEVNAYYEQEKFLRQNGSISEQNEPGPPGWTHRVVAEDELKRLNHADPELSYSTSKQILARLNVRAPYYIEEDIKHGRPLKVPNDFGYYKNWTPLPLDIPEFYELPKLILVVKDIPFLGWYEYGRLVGDSHACIGKSEGWTRAGIFNVKEKDIDHVSASYTNADGMPSPMPWALRIYGHIWIHAGDIEGGYCSRGCINLPMVPAQELYGWADLETVVVVVNTLADLQGVLDGNQCTLYAGNCSRKSNSS
jgi:hypothetical protein